MKTSSSSARSSRAITKVSIHPVRVSLAVATVAAMALVLFGLMAVFA